ncbi:unnamed protein product [Prunus armeniaca]|uniref:60S ribosomal protein L18a-like protein n=1 Tax=Prunus armeniaca TaxID=36596 RepID=A0A6J5UKC2_PRUAR|nr:unnamed protein product [Prunus armeniaca]
MATYLVHMIFIRLWVGWPKIDEPKNGKQKSKVQQNEKYPKLPGCQSRQLSQLSTKLKPLPNNLLLIENPPSSPKTQIGSKMSDDSKTRGLAGDQQSQNQSQQYYGTFQGVANYYPTVPPPPPEPVVGFPQPVPPPGSTGRPPLPPHHQHHHHHHHHRGYQTVTGYAVVEGRPVHERRLPCCGMGIGWLLFIIGFFLGGIPWYVGTFILLCVRVDYREKPGYVACTIAVSAPSM